MSVEPAGSRAVWLRVVSVAVLALLAWIVFGTPFVNGDIIHGLIWGRDIAHGMLPAYDEGPTPHPFTNLLGALLSPLGPSGAYHASQALGLLFFGALLVAVFELGRTLFSWPVGLVAVALVVTSERVVDRAAASVHDIPAVALVLAAITVLAKDSRRLRLAAVLVTLAGLIRSEYWLLGAALGLWALIRRDFGTAAVCSLAPLIWIGTDLIVTGDPLWSLTHTQELAGEIGRTTGLGAAPEAFVDGLRGLVAGRHLLTFAAAGALLALWRCRGGIAWLLGLIAAGAITYLAIGVANLSLIDRYLIPTAIAMCMCAAYLVAGWTAERDRGPRIVLLVIAVPVTALLLLTAPDSLRALRTLQDRTEHRVAMIDSLRSIAGRARCEPMHLPFEFGIMPPTVAHVRGATPGDAVRFDQDPGAGTFIAPVTSDAVELAQPVPSAPQAIPRQPGREVAAGRWWRVTRAEACRSPAP